MQLRSFDYFADKPTHHAGMTRLATLMRDLRSEAEARGDVVIALDNGDSLQGTPLEEEALTKPSGPHIFYKALDLMGYDAAGLGNHDFNFDLDHLVTSLHDAPLPVLCSNARRVDGGPLPVRRWTILDRVLKDAPIKIGVFSVLPPQTLVWDADHLSGHLTVDDITDSARTALSELRAKGCEIVIALAHTGLGERFERTGQENALWPLSHLPGLDAVIAGHTHLQLPDPNAAKGTELAQGVLNGTPVVMPGAGGEHLGTIDLDLAHDGTSWRVTGYDAQLHAVLAEEDAKLSELTAPLHQATRNRLAQKVGHTPVPLHSYFGFVAPSPALALVAAAKEHALRKLLPIHGGDAVLSSVAPAKMGGRGGPNNYVDIPAGPLSLRHVFDLCFFPNRLAAVRVTGAQLADWIEMSLGIYNQIDPGRQSQPLLDASRPAFGSDLFYGVTYEIDLSRPARFDAQGVLTNKEHRRLTRLKYQGKKVNAGDRFIVALSSYRANGGGNVYALQSAERIDLPHILVRDALRDYLLEGQFPSRPWEELFSFKSLDQTSVLARTGPGAKEHLREIGEIHNGYSEEDDQGFLQIGLTL